MAHSVTNYVHWLNLPETKEDQDTEETAVPILEGVAAQ